jgi:hypothetical protein
MHHSLTDGQGLVQLLSMAHSRTRLYIARTILW